MVNFYDFSLHVFASSFVNFLTFSSNFDQKQLISSINRKDKCQFALLMTLFGKNKIEFSSCNTHGKVFTFGNFIGNFPRFSLTYLMKNKKFSQTFMKAWILKYENYEKLFLKVDRKARKYDVKMRQELLSGENRDGDWKFWKFSSPKFRKMEKIERNVEKNWTVAAHW